MKVLVACEESQEVCKAFRALGHEAYSCDIEPCSGGHPEWHLQCDALELLKMRWDLIIAHPPCTYLTNAGDTVLDCCMGSGSIGVACVQTGRKYIGMENDLAIFESAKRRLEGTK